MEKNHFDNKDTDSYTFIIVWKMITKELIDFLNWDIYF